MSKTALKEVPSTDKIDRITPHWHQNAKEIQKFGTVISEDRKSVV